MFVMIIGRDSVGYGAWGKGASRDEALAMARKHGRLAVKHGYTVLTWETEPVGVAVRWDGSVVWEDGTEPTIESVPSKIKAKA